ncbi:hypothetical protein DWV16_17570 [Anaerotruncus sp. AF02-27]|uniref:putative HNHc nuclease n=2 Tax=Anaerotruncus TaxID=244127 RepID=UPI000E4E6E41|nr:putative HNHc nuclease [Anaerotruncus sp. AF02-27]RGX52919.1 hypothetical protein DWV16_17570 [Anaerotruncus sp. AF02-27]
MDTEAKILSFGGGKLVLEADKRLLHEVVEHQVKTVRLVVPDGRSISPRQRNKIFALSGDIADFVAGIRHSDKRRQHEFLCALQMNYLLDISTDSVRRKLTYHYCQLCGIDLFSLSDGAHNAADMSTARDFIDWMIELCIEYGIPCMDTLLNLCEDTQRYLYACVMHRTCAVCGKHADIHEWDRVGMGRDREDIHHEGQRVQPLCRECHNEVHAMGQEPFDKLHHITWIQLTEEMCRKLGWKA